MEVFDGWLLVLGFMAMGLALSYRVEVSYLGDAPAGCRAVLSVIKP